ncbi:F0F1 ATP synthase subunit A [Candidatus Parcubacteria bacterium]|nr:F0F1 ATP synthase subunit A [Candidatus Parcubacteria bacterium]
MHISLKAETLFHIGSWPVNNSLLAGVIGSVLIAVVFALGARRVKHNPSSRLAQGIEALSELLIDLIEGVTHDRRRALRFFPLLMTLFIFILISNWLGLLPGVGSITVTTAEGEVPLLRGANADLNTTLALAIISVVMTQVYAVRELGIVTHLRKYFSRNPVLSFVGLLEIISEFSKMISFSFRLFGNIFAGEVLLIVISALVPLLGPLPFFALELFVGLIQALVFTMLSLVFLEIASSSHGEEHAGDQSGGQLGSLGPKAKHPLVSNT